MNKHFDRQKSVDYAMSGKLLPQALRYAVAAFSGFAADYAALWLLTDVVCLHYMDAGIISFLLGLAVNYCVGRRFVFKVKGKSSLREILGFSAVSLCALAINEAVLWLATDGLGLHHMVSKLASGALTFVWNYLMRRCAVYKKESVETGANDTGDPEK